MKSKEFYQKSLKIKKPLIYKEEKQINGIDTQITTSSPYPIPWNNSLGDRPEDYYEKQSKVIRYYKFDKKVKIKIPPVEQGKNRERMISVFIDEEPFDFENNNILDMSSTFKLADANLLINSVENTSNSKNSHVQAIAPFIYLSDVSQHLYIERKEVDETDIDIITLSPYLIPWPSSIEDKPKDYYEKQSKVIYYYKFDKKIEIKIPSVPQGEHREQLITVLIDDKPFKLKHGKLNRKKYGNITEVISSVLKDWYREEGITELCSSIIKDWDGDEDKDSQFNKEKQGDIIRNLSPFIEEMSKLNGLSLVRELLIPVAMKGVI